MPLKTENDIERDFYNLVKASPLAAMLKGEIYRSEMRPYDAKTEDMVINFLTGLDEQIQTGIVVINAYVPAIAYGKKGQKVANKERIGQLQTAFNQWMLDFADTEYLLETESTPTTVYLEQISQHVTSFRIKFKRISV